MRSAVGAAVYGTVAVCTMVTTLPVVAGLTLAWKTGTWVCCCTNNIVMMMVSVTVTVTGAAVHARMVVLLRHGDDGHRNGGGGDGRDERGGGVATGVGGLGRPGVPAHFTDSLAATGG